MMKPIPEQKREFIKTLDRLAKADERLIDCVNNARKKVNAAQSAERLVRIDMVTSKEVRRILSENEGE